MSRILVIDDETAVLRNVGLMLEMEGYQVQMADTGRDGLHCARTQPLDLIICDAAMPDMGGGEVLHALHADPRTRHIPVILITGMRDEERMRLLLASGAAALLHKPFTHAQLMQVVSTHLAAGT